MIKNRLGITHAIANGGEIPELRNPLLAIASTLAAIG
jgi:hypothetical protein